MVVQTTVTVKTRRGKYPLTTLDSWHHQPMRAVRTMESTRDFYPWNAGSIPAPPAK